MTVPNESPPPSWFAATPQESAHWRANLDLARSRIPESAHVVEASLDQLADYLFFKVDDETFAVKKRENGQDFVFYNPAVCAQKIEASFQRAKEMIQRGCRLTIVMGAGLGMLSRKLQPVLQERESAMLLLVEPRAELIAAQWSLLDCKEWLESEQVFWAVGEDLFSMLEEVFQREAFFSVPIKDIAPIPERELTPQERGAMQKFGGWLSDSASAYIQRFQAAKTRFDQQVKTPANLETGVAWSAVSPDAYAHSPLIESLLSGFAGNGMRKQCIQLRPGGLFSQKIGGHIIETCPDIYMMLHTPSRRYIDEEINRPRVIWYLDHPAHFNWDEYQDQFYERDFVFYSDREYKKYFAKTKAGGFDYLPVCPSIQRTGEVQERFKADVMFVGNYTPVTNLLGPLPPSLRAQAFAWLKARIADPKENAIHAARQAGVSDDMIQRMRNAAETFTSRIARPFPGENGRLEYFCYALANSFKREQFVSALLDFDLALYGPNTWTLLLGEKHKSHYRGWLSNDELPDAYRSAKVCVNIHSLQCPTCLNSRDFDILASQGVLLSDEVEDARTGLIEPGQDFAIYQSAEDLKETVSELLQNPSRIEELRACGHQTFQERHTSTHRAKVILDRLKETAK